MFKAIINFFKTEPALVLGFLQAGLSLGLGFGLNLSTMQQGEIMAFAAAFLAMVIRSNVTPVAALRRASKDEKPAQ